MPADDDRQELRVPAGVELSWVVRDDAAVPGAAALETVRALPVPDEQTRGWVAGEQSLASGIRRHWVAGELAKDRIAFCGYWRAGRAN